VFINTLDHVLEFDKVIHEIRRVLKPGGMLIAEIVPGSKDERGREPGAYESVWWDHVDSVAALIERRGFDLKSRTFFDYPWNGDQFVYVKAS